MDTIRSRSRVSTAWPTGRRKSIDGTNEQGRDFRGPLDQRDLDETGEHRRVLAQTIRNRYGYPLSVHDIATNSVLPQTRAQHVNEHTLLEQGLADKEEGWAETQAKSHQRHGIDFAVQSTPAVNRPTGHSCVVCQDPIYGAEIRAPCGHYYDPGCITNLFRSATRDETLYPPRCCGQNIPFSHVQPHLSNALITLFRQKQAEYTTLKRVYCSSPSCSRFLGPLSEGAFAKTVYICPAPECRKRTCTECRAEHAGDWTHVCRPETDAAQVLALGRAAGWVRCPGCSHMIELHAGCFHVTCRCRTEFCYLCGARWKTCRCPQWDERRVVAAAEERVDVRAAEVRLGQDAGVRRNEPARPERPVRFPARMPFPGRYVRVPNEVARGSLDVRSAPVRVPVRGTVKGLVPTRHLGFAGPPIARLVRPPRSINDAMRQRVALEMMERLRADHECHHSLWRYQDGWHGACRKCVNWPHHSVFDRLGCDMIATVEVEPSVSGWTAGGANK